MEKFFDTEEMDKQLKNHQKSFCENFEKDFYEEILYVKNQIEEKMLESKRESIINVGIIHRGNRQHLINLEKYLEIKGLSTNHFYHRPITVFTFIKEYEDKIPKEMIWQPDYGTITNNNDVECGIEIFIPKKYGSDFDEYLGKI